MPTPVPTNTPEPTSTPVPTLTPTPSPDRATLVSLYRATDGPNWSENGRWLSDRPIGEWRGVRTNDHGRVTELILRDNGLVGAVPADLATLSSLKVLVLASNHLDGEIPPELGKLSNLEVLSLSMNRLRGEIPGELGDLSNLVNLRLDGNQLTGVIPGELGGLSSLTGFNVADNQLGGEIPPELADLKQLGTLFLSRNPGLIGCIPEDLMAVENNDFERMGFQPCDVLERSVLAKLFQATGGDNWANNDGWLSDAPLGQWHGVSTDPHGRVVSLDLTNNDVSGGIPGSLSRLTRLHQLKLGGNQISGCLPLDLFAVPDNDFHVLDVPNCPPPVTMEDVRALPWFADGLDEDERWAVNSLKGFIGSADDLDQRLADQVVYAGWFTDGIVWDDAWTIGVLADIVANYRHILPAVVEFEWAFDDDLPWREWNTITRVRDLELFNPGSGVLLVEFPWLYDGITHSEDGALGTIRHVAEFFPGQDELMIRLPWMADGITYAESQRLDGMSNVMAAASTLERDYSGLLSLLVDEPDGPYRPIGVMLMRAFGQIPENEGERRMILEKLVDTQWFADGLSDVERVHIVGLSSEHGNYRELPNLNTAVIRSGTFELPLAGDVTMWFVGAGAIPSAWIMENLEEAARGVEELMGEPFPFSVLVAALVDRLDYEGRPRPFAARSFHEGQRIEIIDGLSEQGMRDVIHHEMAHTYFNKLVGAKWFTEAGAEYCREYIQERKGYAEEDRHIRITRLVLNDCTAKGVMRIREALVDGPQIPPECKFKIGLHLLLRMEKAAGFDAMSAALTELYRTASVRGLANSDREIYEAFLNNAPTGTETQVQEVWDNLYGPFTEEEE